MGALDKLRHWLTGALDFFAIKTLWVVAAAAVGSGLLLVFTRLQKKWRAKDDPTRAILLLLAAFVVFFFAAHTMQWLTTYLRFLVPVTPWIFLLTAWVVALTFKFTDRGRLWPGLVAALGIALFFLAPLGLALATGSSPLQQPIPEDDVPTVVAWVDKNAAPGAIVFNRKLGPEFDFAISGTDVKQKQLVLQPEGLKPYALRKLGRDLFFIVSHKYHDQWRAFLDKDLAPIFALEEIDLPLKSSRLYRVAVRATGGVQGERISYLRDGELVQEPLSCGVLGSLIWRTLGVVDTTAFAWQVCDPTPTPGILAWQAGNFSVSGLKVSKAGFYYDQPRLDWPALALAERLVIKEHHGARSEFMILTEALAAFAQRKNKNLDDLSFTIAVDGIILEAKVRLPGRQVQLKARGTLEIAGDRVNFRLLDASLGGISAPRFILNYAENVMNPAFKLDLRAWKLKPAAIRYIAYPGNAIVLTAVGE